MNFRDSFERIMELGEAITRHAFLVQCRPACAEPIPPAPEEAALQVHLQNLNFNTLYAAIVALEIGRGVLHPADFMTAYLAAGSAFPLHFQAVERLLKD